MIQSEDLSLSKRRKKRQLLVENKLTFTGPESELSIYDTYRASSRVGLNAPQLMYCGMVKGKKIMHNGYQDNNQGQIFLPHESYVMPPGGYVEIDFPEANESQPTTCLTIELSKDRIAMISERMRDLTTLDNIDHDWEYHPQTIHTYHTTDTQQLLEKLVSLFTNNHPDKKMMMDLSVSELIIRLLRQQGRELILNYSRQSPDSNGITAVVNYIEKNITLPLDVEQLCKCACMSRSKLYIEFKKQLGCSPSEYLHQQRLKLAAEMLQLGKTITEACYDVGFNDLSHFSRRFTQFFNCSPSQYRTKHYSDIPLDSI